MVCSAPAPPKHILPFKRFRKTSAKNATNSPEGQMYFSCKTVAAATVCLDYSYESSLGKILGLFSCLKSVVYCLLAVTSVAKVKCGQQMIESSPKSVSAAHPKFPRQICGSARSATLQTQLLRELLSCRQPRDATLRNTQRWEQGRATAPLSPKPRCPVSVWHVPGYPGAKEGEGVGILVPKYSVCYQRPFLPALSTQ